MIRYVGLLVIVGGLCLVFAGLLIYTGWLSWFGRLPGDIRYESDHVQVYVPIVSMLIVSVVLSDLFVNLCQFPSDGGLTIAEHLKRVLNRGGDSVWGFIDDECRRNRGQLFQ